MVVANMQLLSSPAADFHIRYRSTGRPLLEGLLLAMHLPWKNVKRRVRVQIAACWKDHCEQMLTIRSTFLYLDRTYVISTSGTRSLFEMGLYAYGQHLAEHPEVMPLPMVLSGLRGMPALSILGSSSRSRCIGR